MPISITDASVVDYTNNNPNPTPFYGERLFVRVDWTTTNLPASATYVMHFTIDGVAIDTSSFSYGAGLTGGPYNWAWIVGGWMATPGSHSVTVSAIDNNQVTESTNSFTFSTAAPTTLPQKFIFPLGGIPFQDWTIINYVDVDPTSGVHDFRGGPDTYNGHNGIDIGLPNFPRMDAGAPIFAAAAGTVVAVADGNFDRNTVTSGPINYVEVDDGNGWHTFYYHCAANTIAVKVGDVVTQGQFLALAGSSGSSSDPHLHFEVQHNGDVVETELDPADYWINPPPYENDVAPYVMDSGISNYNLFGDMKERPTSVTTFPVSTAWDVWFWTRLGSMPAGTALLIDWYRPDGTLATEYPSTSGNANFAGLAWVLGASTWSAFPGTWHVAMKANGVEITRQAFTVTTGAGNATAKLAQGTTNVINHRTTPIDFGTSATAQSLDFTVQNIGSAALTLSALTLPPGFSLVGTFPSSEAAGTSATFTLRMDATPVGAKFGAVSFTTNDPNAPTYSFNIAGTITGGPDPNAPVLALPGPAAYAAIGSPPKLIDTSATITDADSPNFNGGVLTVSVAVNGTADDRLSVQNVGIAPGVIGVNGSNVTYGGTSIGTLAGGVGLQPLTVTLNANATLPAVQALLRAVTWADVSLTPSTYRRYIRFSITDNTARPSNQPIKTIDLIPPQPLSLSGNNIYLKMDPDGRSLDAWINAGNPGNGLPTQKTIFTAISKLTLTGAGAGSTLTLDFSNGNFASALPRPPIIDAPAGGNNTLAIVGTTSSDMLNVNASSALFSSSAAGFGAPVNLSLANIQNIQFHGVSGGGGAADTLNLLAGNYSLDADTPTGSPNVGVIVGPAASAAFLRDQHLASLTINGSSALVTPGAARKTISANALSILGSGRLDLTINNLLTFTAPTAIRGYLLSAYSANDDWSGPAGLTSSTASSNPVKYTIGYATASDQSAQDAGLTLAPGQTLVRPSLVGDANLDGKVDFFDLTQILAYKYNTNQPASYTDGDLNFDGNVNFFDIATLLSANYNTGVTFSPASVAATAGAAAAAPAAAQIAEPSVISAAAAAAPTAPPVPDLKRRRTRWWDR
jgi:hypothetical protein